MSPTKNTIYPAKFHAALFVAVSFLLCMIHAFAQDGSASPTPTPDSPEVQRLKEEKTQAELRQAIAEANKAELEAKFPKPSTTPLAGTTTVDGAVIESQMVSYHQMALAANQMIDQIKADINPAIKTIAIYNQSDVNLLLSYKTAYSQLQLIQKGYGNLEVEKPPDCNFNPLSQGLTAENLREAIVGPVAPIKIAESVFGSFIDLTALLRTNVEIKGQTFDLDQTALISEVFRAAKSKDGFSQSVTLYYPEAFPPLLNRSGDSKILGLLNSLNTLKSYTEKLINGLEDNDKNLKKGQANAEALKAQDHDLNDKVTAAQEELARLERIYGKLDEARGLRRRIPPEIRERMLKLADDLRHLKDDLTELEKPETGKIAKAKLTLAQLRAEQTCLLSKLTPNFRDPDKLEDTLGKLKAQNDQFSKFLEALVKADSVSGMNPLTSYIKAELLQTALDGDGSYWLQLKVLKAGGNNRIKTNLLWDIFTGGSRLSHSGGAIIEYILFNRDGEAVKSDTFTTYSGYIKAGKVKNLPNP